MFLKCTKAGKRSRDSDDVLMANGLQRKKDKNVAEIGLELDALCRIVARLDLPRQKADIARAVPAHHRRPRHEY